MLLRRLFVAFVILGLVGPSFSQDKDKDKKEVKKEEKKDDKKDDKKAPAGGDASIQWKFEKDKTFYQTMTTDTKQTMKVMQMDITQNQKQTFYFSWTPKEQDKEKNWIIKQKIEGIQMDIDIGGNKVTFDSTKDAGTANPLADFFKALIGSEFTLTVSPDYKVTKIEGREEFLKKLSNTNPQMKPMLEQILSDEALKQMADPAFAVVPGVGADGKVKQVKAGDTWSKNSKLNMGPIGSYDTKYDYKLEGVDKNIAKIGVKTTLTYTPPSDTAASQLPFKIEKADLKSSNASGTILFDVDKGRLSSSDLDLKLEGKLTIKIQGAPTEVELTQSQKTTVKTSDENPIKKAS